MKIRTALCLIFLVVTSHFALAFQHEFRWGGPGYDPALKGRDFSRFTARLHFKNKTIIDIMVDHKKTVGEVGRIDLISAEGAQISSEYCWKAMKHIQAPWACSFQKGEINEKRGVGRIKVFNRSNELLIEDAIDFDAINNQLGLESNKTNLMTSEKKKFRKSSK